MQYSQGNTCARAYFLNKAGLSPATLLKKLIWNRCFPVNLAKVLRPVSGMLIFTHVRIFQLIRIGISITMRTQCGLFCRDLDKTKIANLSNITFSLMACKTSLFLLNKIHYFYLYWFIAEKSVWSNKGKERCDFQLVSSKSSSSQFWFSFM